MSDLRDQILNIKDSRIEKISVPQWPNVEVYIKQWSAEDQDLYSKECLKSDGEFNTEHARVRLVVSALCDAEGNKLFTNKDYDALGKKSVAALDHIIKAINELNSITVEKLEEMAKN